MRDTGVTNTDCRNCDCNGTGCGVLEELMETPSIKDYRNMISALTAEVKATLVFVAYTPSFLNTFLNTVIRFHPEWYNRTRAWFYITISR